MFRPATSQPLLDRVERLVEFDRACVVTLNRVLIYRPCTLLARWISRLGNGELWFLLMVALSVLQGQLGTRCALHVGVVSLAGVLLYVLIKRHAGRPRPYVELPGLRVCARPLDEYSFPSGHTLHAVAFAIIVSAYFPALGLVLVPFAVLTGVVRVVLGLHYPSDVLAGVVVGAGLALLSLALVPAI